MLTKLPLNWLPAALGALMIVLVAWLAPLPPLGASPDDRAVQRIVEVRLTVEEARERFSQAQRQYRDYVRSRDVGAALQHLEQAVGGLTRPRGDRLEQRLAVRDAAAPVLEYLSRLEQYAAAGDRYLDALRRYDDELMAWTRSLGGANETLRSETWPFVEHIKLYPQPFGERNDVRMITASEVASRTAELQNHIAALNPDPNPHGSALTIDQVAALLAADLESVRESGKSVELAAGLHDQYRKTLQEYDSKVQAVAAQVSRGAQSTDASAVALNLALGLITLAAVAAVLRSNTRQAISYSAR